MSELEATLLERDLTARIHLLPISIVYSALATQPEGISEDEAEARLMRHGKNIIRGVRGRPLYLKFLANFTHLMAILLWVGGLIAFAAQLPQLALATWMVNVINGVFAFWQEYKAEKATEALRQLLPSYIQVERDGEERHILAEELVPGDIILLTEGDRIPADARLVYETELRVDQSTLTGESHPVRKTSETIARTDLARADLSNLVFAGTTVAAGSGKAAVFATGMGTEFGKIAHLTQSVSEELSPLQKEIGTLTKMVTVIAVGVGLVFFVLAIMLARISLAEGFIFALGMIVAFVPEGLLPTVTLALAMGTQRMARRNALIKRLSAVETLGCTTVICTDKTGTLTQNEMTVCDMWLAGKRLTVTGVGYAPVGQVLDGNQLLPRPANEDLRQLLVAAGLCNNARLLHPNGVSTRWTVLGDPTEGSLLVVALKGGLNLEEEGRRSARLRELPFDSRRKRMSTVHRVRAGRVAYVKGAPKEMLALCTQIFLDGHCSPLEDSLRMQIMAANDDYARIGLRVLAVAMRNLPDGLADYTPEAIERDLTFLGLMAMMDPPRPEVAEAVTKCHHAGIRIIMVTGDYGLTAESIARRIGIIRGPQVRIITGAELDVMENEALKEALGDEIIFARVSPQHKLRLATVLEEMEHVVAVTGDGVNDAPALKKASVGVAMGLAGTDVAREAADMILTDDNFASIVNAIEEGRTVYSNIKKFTTYIFTSNTPEAVPFILFALSRARIPLALNIMHVLSIDLGTDMMPALALGAEPAEPGVMDRPPRSLKEHVITPALLLRAFVLLGSVQSLAAMAAFYFQYWTNGYWGQWLDLPSGGLLYRSATAMALSAVVTTQIGNLFAQRTERSSVSHISPFSNPMVWVGIATELALILLIVYLRFFEELIGTAAFPLENWVFLFAWTPSLLVADELHKALLRWRERQAALRTADAGR